MTTDEHVKNITKIAIVIPTIILMIISFYLFAKATMYLPISTAYAVFTGIGSFGTAFVGMAFFGDEVNVMKIMLYRTQLRNS